MIRYLFFLFVGNLLFTGVLVAQEEDEDCEITNKKVLKILDKVKSPKLAGPQKSDGSLYFNGGMRKRFCQIMER